jgi:hypothetical protein
MAPGEEAPAVDDGRQLVIACTALIGLPQFSDSKAAKASASASRSRRRSSTGSRSVRAGVVVDQETKAFSAASTAASICA